MGFLLYIISVILGILLIPVGIIYGFFRNFYHTHIGYAIKKTNAKFLKMAVGLDIFGNVYGEELLNTLLIKREATYKFGEFGTTVSAILGASQYFGTLTPLGKAIANTLNKLQKDHCLNAYESMIKK